MRYTLQAVLILAAVTGAMAVVGPGSHGEAHHYDQGHTGTPNFILDGLPNPPGGPDQRPFEMNSRTAQGLKIQIHANNASANWQNALASAQANWNAALQSTAGFDVYGTGYLPTVEVVSVSDSSVCGAGNHGCVAGWNPNTPSAQITMYDPAFSDQTHRVSDLMHEMGHVLYYGDEHYPGYGYDCVSIMAHCPSVVSQAQLYHGAPS